jgi:Pectinesterase
MPTLTVGTGGGFDFTSIQDAVAAAGNGDVIDVAAGTYREQVTVTGKSLTIHGAGTGRTIIESPDASQLVANAIDTNSGRPNKFAVITVTDNADVTIEGLTVDGRDQGAVPASNYVTGSNHDFLGIYVLNSDAHIDGVAVTVRTSLPAPMSPASSAIMASSSPATMPRTAVQTPATPSRSRTRPSAASRRTASSSTARR